MRTLATVEAGKAKTSVHDAGRTDVEKTKEVVEAPPDAGKEAEQPELQPEREEPRPQPQQDQPEEQAARLNGGWSCHCPTCRWWHQQMRGQSCPKCQLWL
jgi:hypothetical protein